MSQVEFPYKIVDKKRKPGLKAKATITKVQVVKAADIFKEKPKTQNSNSTQFTVE